MLKICSSSSFLTSFTIRLSLLVLFVMVTSFILFMVKKHSKYMVKLRLYVKNICLFWNIYFDARTIVNDCDWSLSVSNFIVSLLDQTKESSATTMVKHADLFPNKCFHQEGFLLCLLCILCVQNLFSSLIRRYSNHNWTSTNHVFEHEAVL